MKKYFGICLFILLIVTKMALGQPSQYTTANAHSHNDYEQDLPFYNAYARHFGSIEADIWAVKGSLFVAHDKNEITPGRTFQELYLKPLINRIKTNRGKAYKNNQSLQLLIDFKSSYSDLIPLLMKCLQPYRKYFDQTINPDAVRIVISGNMPPPDSLYLYDPMFTFDGRLGNHYTERNVQRVKLVSADVQNLVTWKNDESLSTRQKEVLSEIIAHVHSKNQLIRFWGTPNTIQAYQDLMELKVDYIGSDDLSKLECWLRKIDK